MTQCGEESPILISSSNGRINLDRRKRKIFKLTLNHDEGSFSMLIVYFQIRVKIFQARQLGGGNIDPVCRVRLIGRVKQTKIQKGSNHPQFNEVFFFNINISEAELIEEVIEFEVLNSRTLRSDMRIGAFKMDMALIYSETKHSINRKWLLLSNDGDRMTGAKGYLKVSVNILGPGDEAPVNHSLALIFCSRHSFFLGSRQCR